MTSIALVFAISLGMQFVALACPAAANFSRETIKRILLNCLAIVVLLASVGFLSSLPLLPLLSLGVITCIAVNSAWSVKSLSRQLFDFAISFPLGLGALSGLWLAWLFLGGRNASIPFPLVACLVSLAMSTLLFKVRHGKPLVSPPEISTKSERNYLIEVAAGLGGASSVLHIACQLAHEPLGLWDAWMLWNTRAHFLFRTAADWMQQFSGVEMFAWLHPDYPLLLPGSISAIWQLNGHESLRAPLLISGIFTASVILIITTGVGLLRSRNQGLLAGLAIMGLPVLYLFGCSQEADVPLAVYMLSAINCFLLYNVTEQTGLLCLSATFAGMAACTKNEGGLFALLFFAFASIGLLAAKQTQSSGIKKWAAFAIALLPWVLSLVLFKVFLAPQTDLLHQSLQEVWSKLLIGDRYVQLFSAFALEFKWFGFPFLILYSLLFGLRFPRSKLIPVLVTAATVFGMFAGYFLVYLISPGDLAELIKGSQERLYLQIWPSLLLLFFSVAQTPEDMRRKKIN